MKTECCLIHELLPLYAEELVSEETAEIIINHLENCPECKEELSILTQQEKVNDLLLSKPQEDTKPFKKMIKKINRQFSMLCYAIVILLMFLGVSFSDGGEMMVRNVIIMPIIGVLGYIIFRYSAFYKIPLMLLCVEIIAFILCIVERDLYLVSYTAAIYLVFILAGILIAMLLHFAFRKE